MIVPNYVPDPLEVPNNVTEERFPLRLQFIRRVMLIHLGTVLMVAGLSTQAFPQVGLVWASLGLAIVLIFLDVWRILARSSQSEATVSLALLPCVVVLMGWVAAEAQRIGFPVWSPAVGVVCAFLYAAVCGRDFSFVGCYFLAWIVSSVAIAGRVVWLGLPAHLAVLALAANTLYLFYFLYDLASLMARRRIGEFGAAVVDLYRDIFNIFGFAVRCVRHWRKHRIWEIVR